MRQSRTVNVIGVVAIAASSWTVAAVAAEPGPAASAVAAPPGAGPAPEELYRRGSEAYRAGRYEEAIELLGRAQRLEPHPELVYDLGRAYESAGDLRHAVESFREYLRFASGAGDRTAVEARIRNIAARLDTARARVTVATHPDDATLTVDGRVLGTTPWKGALTAGPHRLVLKRVGHREAARYVIVQRGQDLVLHLDLEAEGPVAPAREPENRKGVLQKIRLPTWIAVGVGAGALAGAAAFEIAAAGAENEARDATTQLGHRASYEGAERDRDVARVLLGVGAVAMVTGAVLFTIDLTRKSPDRARGQRAEGLRLEMGVQRVHVEGWF